MGLGSAHAAAVSVECFLGNIYFRHFLFGNTYRTLKTWHALVIHEPVCEHIAMNKAKRLRLDVESSHVISLNNTRMSPCGPKGWVSAVPG